MHSIPDEYTEGIPLAGILFFGPLISVPLWLVIGFVGWVLFF
jgi:hypothetical protein